LEEATDLLSDRFCDDGSLQDVHTYKNSSVFHVTIKTCMKQYNISSAKMC